MSCLLSWGRWDRQLRKGERPSLAKYSGCIEQNKTLLLGSKNGSRAADGAKQEASPIPPSQPGAGTHGHRITRQGCAAIRSQTPLSGTAFPRAGSRPRSLNASSSLERDPRPREPSSHSRDNPPTPSGADPGLRLPGSPLLVPLPGNASSELPPALRNPALRVPTRGTSDPQRPADPSPPRPLPHPHRAQGTPRTFVFVHWGRSPPAPQNLRNAPPRSCSLLLRQRRIPRPDRAAPPRPPRPRAAEMAGIGAPG